MTFFWRLLLWRHALRAKKSGRTKRRRQEPAQAGAQAGAEAEAGAQNAVDLTRDLPDVVLAHILFFVDTKTAVATSILARRWRNIWTLVPKIEIYDIDVNTPTEDDFYQLINHLLLPPFAIPPQNLRKFSLTCEEHGRPASITNLILAAFHRNVQELEISIAEGQDWGVYELPMQVFTNPNLRMLEVSRVRVQVPLAPSFPALEILHVDISTGCDPTLEGVYSRCPVLNKLVMEGELTEFPDVNRTFDILSGSLRTLRIELEADFFPGKNEGEDMRDLYHFNIHAPNLQNLVIDDDILATYEIRNLSSLNKATVQSGWTDLEYNNADLNFVATAFETLGGLIHARYLELGERTMGALGFVFHQRYLLDNVDGHFRDEVAVWNLVGGFPKFPHLTDLKLLIANQHGWNFFFYLLECFPSLKRLTIQKVIIDGVRPNAAFAWNPPAHHPSCLTKTISRVEIRGLQNGGNEGHLDLVNAYFTEIAATDHGFDYIIIN